MKKGWTVSWINVDFFKKMKAVRLIGNSKMLFNVKKRNLEEWLGQIKEKHIVVIDGNFDDYFADLETWLESAGSNRRLGIVVSSVGGLRGNLDVVLANLNAKMHKVDSWSLEEFLEVAKNETFWKSVKAKFEKYQEMTRQDLVRSKFFYAGASARYMFDFTVTEVKKKYNEAFKNVTSLQDLILFNAGVSSKPMIHRLISVRDDVVGFVSEYVAQQLTLKYGINAVDIFRDS